MQKLRYLEISRSRHGKETIYFRRNRSEPRIRLPPHDSLGKKNPYIPSFDRINPRGGYTTDNVRIVIMAVNIMLLDWGTDIFEQVANSYRYWNRTKSGISIPAPSIPAPAPKKISVIPSACHAKTALWWARQG